MFPEAEALTAEEDIRDKFIKKNHCIDELTGFGVTTITSINNMVLIKKKMQVYLYTKPASFFCMFSPNNLVQ